MPDSISISPAAALIIAISALALLEILFLFARIIENEKSLHDLKVRSHKLRREMIASTAEQLVDEMEYEQQQTGRSWQTIFARHGIFAPPDDDPETSEQPQPNAASHSDAHAKLAA